MCAWIISFCLCPELLMAVLTWPGVHGPWIPTLFSNQILPCAPAGGGSEEAQGHPVNLQEIWTFSVFPDQNLSTVSVLITQRKRLHNKWDAQTFRKGVAHNKHSLEVPFLWSIHTIKFHYRLNFHVENGCHKSTYKLFTSLLNEGLSKNCHGLSICSMAWATTDNLTNIFNIPVIS